VVQAEIDWRIDVKSASERGRMSVPTVLVQLQVEKSPSRVDEETQHENVTFELDRATYASTIPLFLSFSFHSICCDRDVDDNV
jgi:hypothetical protein